MQYHFKVFRDDEGYWGNCLELEGCRSQAPTLEELNFNVKEALSLYLDEPFGSNVVPPLPDESIKVDSDILLVNVDPEQAFTILLKNYRINKRMTQLVFQKKLGFKYRNSYARLETGRANPRLMTLNLIKETFPDFPIEKVFSQA